MAKEQAFLPNRTFADAVLDRIGFENHPSYVMGTIHVWVWRRSGEGVEILVQRRSLSKKNHPGLLDISVAGHVDAGERHLETAARECGEELGLNIDVDKLFFTFSIRKTNTPNTIATVYLYEVDNDFSPVFQDGEVDEVVWKTINNFEQMTKNPSQYDLADHGAGYYAVLIERLRLQ